MKFITSSRSARRGVAAVDCAIVLPVLVGFVLGVIEIGRAYEVRQLMMIAVREGGRLGAMDVKEFNVPNDDPVYFDVTNEKIEQDIQNYLTAGGVDGTITFDIDEVEFDDDGNVIVVDENFDISGDNSDLPYYRITIDLSFDDVAYLPATFLRGQNLGASVIMRATDRVSLNGG